MTIRYPNATDAIAAGEGVYAPQADSHLLIEAISLSGAIEGARVLDFCAGTGVVGIAAAMLGARHVTAIDMCRRAVDCCRRNAQTYELDVDVRLGTLVDALDSGPYDVVLCNPPYMPESPGFEQERHAAAIGSPLAWNAGADGRRVLDPLCAQSAALLTPSGSMFIVQSVVADVQQTLQTLNDSGLTAAVIARRELPFGPVMRSRVAWLKRTGRLPVDCGTEEIVVIRGDHREGGTSG